MKLQLYPWQEECLQSWFSHHCRGIINVVTGAGKTVFALSAAEALRTSLSVPLRVKIIVPQIFLTSQWAGAMQKLFNIPRQEIGCYYGTHKASPDHPYMIYVINSARYSLSRHILHDIQDGYGVLLIADECHHYASRENRKIFEFIPCLKKENSHFYSLGLSATPQTAGYEQYLKPALGQEIYRYSFRDAALQKSIRSFVCFNISLLLDAEENAAYLELSERLSHTTGLLFKRCPELKNLRDSQYFHALKHLAHSKNDTSPTSRLARTILLLTYQRKTVLYNADARIRCALDLIRQLSSDSRIVIFGERIEQADLLYAQLLERYPRQVTHYHSKMEPELRKSALEQYRSGDCRILVACRALDEGFDIPSANVGIVLSSSSVQRQRIQRLGRILRNSSGEQRIASLYYLYIKASTESPSYLEITEGVGAASFFLSYSSGGFYHPTYEKYSASILAKLKAQGKTPDILAEYSRCLDLGLLRPDWLLMPSTITSHIDTARTTREKNYWICMKLMALYRLEQSSAPDS